MLDLSTRKPSKELITEIRTALKNIKDGYGSIEIFVQNFKVVQITERNIRKTNNIDNQNINSIIDIKRS